MAGSGKDQIAELLAGLPPSVSPPQLGDEPVGGAPAAEATPPAITSLSMPIQIGSLGASPPLFRFVIAPLTEDSAAFYVAYWPLGQPGAEGKGNVQMDSGVDVPLPEDVTIPGKTAVRVPLGIRARGLTMYWGPPGMPPGGIPSPFLILPRGSLTKPGVRQIILTNSPGLVDAGYTGQLFASLYNLGDAPVTLKKGEAVVQLTAPSFSPPEYTRADPGSPFMELFEGTARAAGGFGSTGAAGSSE